MMNDDQHYGSVAKLFHWVTAGLIVALFGFGWIMTGLPLSAEKFELYNLHKSIGVAILSLMILRVIWRCISTPPPLPSDLSASIRTIARLGHIAIYLAVFTQVGVGLIHSWSANFPVIVFSSFTLPSLTQPDEAMKEIMSAIHYWGSWLIVFLIAGHVGAALHHHFVRRDTVLKRMLPWG